MTPRTRDLARQLANAFIIPAAIVINLWLGREVGEVSVATEPLLSAAGWTFAVWNLLFVGMLAYAVYQALPAHRTSAALRRIGPFTALASAATGAWVLFFTHRQFTAAWVTIVVCLGALIAVEVLLRDSARSDKALWFVRVPFGLLLGWISAATMINTAQWLTTTLRWNGAPLTPLSWSLVLVFSALVLGFVMGLARRNLSFVAALAWALAGIAAKTSDASAALSYTAVAAFVALTLLFFGEIVAMRTGRLSLDLQGHHRWV